MARRKHVSPVKASHLKKVRGRKGRSKGRGKRSAIKA
jgi:hypothetical protein